jgi:hypothetical protein
MLGLFEFAQSITGPARPCDATAASVYSGQDHNDELRQNGTHNVSNVVRSARNIKSQRSALSERGQNL